MTSPTETRHEIDSAFEDLLADWESAESWVTVRDSWNGASSDSKCQMIGDRLGRNLTDDEKFYVTTRFV